MIRRAALPRAETSLPAIGTVQHYAPQQTILAEGEPALHVMLIIHGMVRSCSSFADGRRFIGAFYGAGDLFGLERNQIGAAAKEAVCETSIVLYPAADWSDAVHAPDDLSRQIFRSMVTRCEQARCHARLLARLHAVERVAAFLIECHLRSAMPSRVTLEMPRQDIADYLGLTVETVSRCLAQLKRQELISLRSARELDLLNISALRAISG